VDFNVPSGTYELNITDDADVLLATASGNVWGTITQVDHFAAYDYLGAIQRTQDFDNLAFDSEPPPPPGPPVNCAEAIEQYGKLTGDLNDDCYVDIADVNIVVSDWLDCFDPNDPRCDRPWE
jgi:hypothetical protein